MLSSPRRLALSVRAARRWWVGCLIRSVRSAIWTSGEPVSLSSRRYAVITSVLLGSVADGTRCPFLILWISYSLVSLPDANRSAEPSKPRKERGELLDALSWVGRRRVSTAGHHEKLGESGLDSGLRLLQGLLWRRETYRDRPADRCRIAAHPRAHAVEGLVERDGLFER